MKARSAVVGGALALLLGLLGLAATAQAAPPSVSTASVNNVSTSGATLRGNIDPEGEATSYYFEWGTTTEYGNRTETGNAGTGFGGRRVRTPITGLEAGTLYHYRVVATNPSGTTLGNDRTFVSRTGFTVTAPRTVTYGRAAVVRGRLVGATLADRRVGIEARDFPFDSPFRGVGTPEVTDPQGAFRLLTPRVTAPGEFRVTTFDSPPSTSEPFRIGVKVRVKTNVSSTRVRRGQRVRFSGTVVPIHTDVPYSVQRRQSKRWVRVARGRTAPAAQAGSSKFAKAVRIRRSGRYRVRVSTTNLRYLPGAGRIITIAVR
jgi:hypothetical protein